MMESLFREPLPKSFSLEAHPGEGQHNLQRKSCLMNAGPVSHGKDVYLVLDDKFDLDRTIFKSVSGMLGFKRLELRNKLGNKLFWDEEKVEKTCADFEGFERKMAEMVLREPSWENYDPLLAFMREECNFNTEHADGSFMDHLYFCRDYSKVHYSQVSPRILFLHSIMGVGTNFFPMEAEKVPQLKQLVDDKEFKHIAAFPSLLRLMNQGSLVKELMENLESLDEVEGITFYRVIDNEEIVFSAEELWEGMNIQVIHQLDFLPCSNWGSQKADPMFQVFAEMYDFLSKSQLLVASVDFDVKHLENVSEKDEFGMPVTVASLLSKRVPAGIKRSALSKSSENFSKAIGHDISYKLQWKNKGKL